MHWTTAIAQGAIDCFSVILIVRFQQQHLKGVYRVLTWYLFFGLLESLLGFESKRFPSSYLDYRAAWVGLKVVDWVLTLWIVYAVLNEVLRNLPGVLQFSRRLLNATFSIAILGSLWTARAEYTASSGAAGAFSPLARVVAVTFIVTRAISTAELVVILAILCFVLWFPVQIPKNIVALTVGLVVYFAATTVSWLAWSFWSSDFRMVDNIVAFVLAICLAFWAISLNYAGEIQPVRIGHTRQEREQERLLGQLEAINASLLRAARR
jgi:hypothetical protein